MPSRRCVQCGKPFEAKRSDAKTCSDACRAQLSRHRRDPQIGTPERRQSQREGLNRKFTYRQCGQVRGDLQRLGLIPSKWEFDSPQFGRADCYPGGGRDDLVPYRSCGGNLPAAEANTPGRWNQGSDGWPLHEPLLATGIHWRQADASTDRVEYILSVKQRRIKGGWEINGRRFRKVRVPGTDPTLRPNLDKCDATYSMRRKTSDMSNVIPLRADKPTIDNRLADIQRASAETRDNSAATLELVQQIAEQLGVAPEVLARVIRYRAA
jgi:hypothetical protein